ncbi:MAG: nucleotidyltransferase substrate binding protein [Salinivirgaceae bacterium]
MNEKELRWKQRYVNLDKAFKLLERTLAIEQPSEAEKGGLIQFYETCFELSWKTLKDYLENEGFEVKSPRETIKQAFQTGIIKHGELWMAALEDRNLTSHIYDEKLINEIAQKIKVHYFALIKELHHFFKDKNE